MIPISKPLIDEEEKRAVQQVLNSGMIAHGKVVEEFEKEFAKYCGAKDAVATTSGTSAIKLALQVEGITSGDEIITTPFSFIASTTPILYNNATPLFVDIDEDNFNLDLTKVEQAITEKTKAILPVHLFGLPVNMDQLQELADKHNLKIIEDACQAHGATFKGKRIGSFNTSCFSFYATKNMACGEGGIITFQDEGLANKARILRNHGSSRRYYHDELAYNYRMTNIHAAIGLEQLKKLEDFNQKRKDNASFLINNLNPSIAKLPKLSNSHAYHQFTVLFPSPEQRDKALDHLEKNQVGTGIFYPVPIHKQKIINSDLELPVAESVSKRVLSLPVHPSLTQGDLNKIVEVFNQC